ncbi:MAG: RelA/SpoT family protein [bacterium]
MPTNDVSSIDLELAGQQLWQHLESKIDYLSQEDKDFVRLGFEVMMDNHKDQRRKSGQYYIVHPVATTVILTELNFDKIILVAALLHDVPEDTFEDYRDGIKMIQKEFGPEVAFLVSGITKLSVIKYRGEKRYVENLRKLFVAMGKDLRVIFIKLADRINNLETLKHLRPDKANRIALESLEIYSPIAERLGINTFRSRIDDLAFRFAYPEQQQHFLHVAGMEIEKRQKQVQKLISKTKAVLDGNEIEYKYILGRAKTFYSIYRKINLENKTLAKIYDLVALRIITNSISNCYKIMSVLHQEFEVMEERTKDYIQKPKANGYQSLHITVRDQRTKAIFEFQIRTQQMHTYAEYGVAAHWLYKSDNEAAKKDNLLNEQSFRWIQQLVDLGNKKMSEQDYLKHVKLNLFPDRIFILTPKGDVIDLPKGATPIDFAFKIHQFIGSHAQLAKINGKVAKLNEELKNGDMVEIITSKNQKPSSDWLNWVKSASSAKHIRAFLRSVGQNIGSITGSGKDNGGGKK